MAVSKFNHDEGSGFYIIQEAEDCEYVNPIEYLSDIKIESVMAVEYEFIASKEPEVARELWPYFFLKRGVKSWNEFSEKLKHEDIPVSFKELLSIDKKKDQIKTLKNQSIDVHEWLAFIMYAWSMHGYTYSRYSCEIGPANLTDKKMPKLAHLDGDEIRKIGQTELTDGQIKNAINHRKVTVSNFLDRESKWHCFFITHQSLKGEENWKGGQTHFHYISSEFGIPRNEVVNRIKSGRYPSTNVHIALKGIGTQTEL